MEHTFEVQGMTCGHCEMAIQRAITRLDQKAQIQIDRQHNKVFVKSELSDEIIKNAIANEGYDVK